MMTHTTIYRIAVGVALAAAFLLAWLSLGVGIIERDGDPANLMYFGVIAVGSSGLPSRASGPGAWPWALSAVALAQALVGAYAIFAGLGRPYSGPLELSLLNGFFVAMFAGSAWLYWRAARIVNDSPNH